mmetsp:Transcript_18963/g.32394  ORF Transcript_18963/g.32394 Transcript_18963/m.32394 type:complete len:255 (-) Transcript_18963:928-1692(-)
MLVAAYVIMTLVRAVFIVLVTSISSTRMLNEMVISVIRAHIQFFDSNPSGRIMTRFSKDIASLDVHIPFFILFITQGLFNVFTVAAIICVLYPLLIIVVLTGVALMLIIVSYLNGAQRETQRHESVLRGPVHSSFQNLLEGLKTIRAYEAGDYFRRLYLLEMENCSNATFTFYSINRLVQLHMDLICVLVSVLVAAYAVLSKEAHQPQILAFTVQILIDLIAQFSLTFRGVIELETLMTSSQRIFRYTQIPDEE